MWQSHLSRENGIQLKFNAVLAVAVDCCALCIGHWVFRRGCARTLCTWSEWGFVSFSSAFENLFIAVATPDNINFRFSLVRACHKCELCTRSVHCINERWKIIITTPAPVAPCMHVAYAIAPRSHSVCECELRTVLCSESRQRHGISAPFRIIKNRS